MKPQDLPLALAARAEGVAIGELVALDGAGGAHVALDGEDTVHAAVSTLDLSAAMVGQRVVLAFEGGDRRRPLVVGMVRAGTAAPTDRARFDLDADGQRLTVVAGRELVLRCGLASILLRADGRIEIRGETLLSQATGVHRIRGGSVQLN